MTDCIVIRSDGHGVTLECRVGETGTCASLRPDSAERLACALIEASEAAAAGECREVVIRPVADGPAVCRPPVSDLRRLIEMPQGD